MTCDDCIHGDVCGLRETPLCLLSHPPRKHNKEKSCPFFRHNSWLYGLPKIHGRLIDADRLIEIMQDTLNGYPDKSNDSNNIEKLLVITCKRFVEHCPTVVEAEVE